MPVAGHVREIDRRGAGRYQVAIAPNIYSTLLQVSTVRQVRNKAEVAWEKKKHSHALLLDKPVSCQLDFLPRAPGQQSSRNPCALLLAFKKKMYEGGL